jgi:site-specific recombinase XerC
MSKITDIQIRYWLKAGAPVAKAQGDVPGLTFTLSANGTASWVLRYRIGGKQRELGIGRYPEYTIARAKTAAMDARAKIQAGVDVAREKRLGQIDRAGSQTFAEVATDYLDKNLPGLAATTQKQRLYHVQKIIVPRIGMVPANALVGADVVALIDKVGEKHGPKVARLVLGAVNEICKHGMARLVMTQNPCVGVSIHAVCGPAAPKRERLQLTDAELRALLPALGDTQTGLTIKLLLATCVRINELLSAEWRHVDLDRGTWTIPTSKTTNKPFIIPLSDAAVGWFEQLKVQACGSHWVLPGQGQRKPLHPASVAAAIDRVCAKVGVRRFTPHDCRSTARSHLAALGVPVLVAERCLNHALGGLVAVYDQHDYLGERRAALALWADYLTACESGREWMPANNVVPIRQAG